MTQYRFEVPGPPVPKGRPRFKRLKKPVLRKGKLRRVITFTPKRTKLYETKVRLCAYTAGVKRLEGEVCLSLWFYLPNRRRVDGDNLAKAIQDALNDVAWTDDDQVTELHMVKAYDPANPRCVVQVESRE